MTRWSVLPEPSNRDIAALVRRSLIARMQRMALHQEEAGLWRIGWKPDIDGAIGLHPRPRRLVGADTQRQLDKPWMRYLRIHRVGQDLLDTKNALRTTHDRSLRLHA